MRLAALSRLPSPNLGGSSLVGNEDNNSALCMVCLSSLEGLAKYVHTLVGPLPKIVQR